MIMVDTLGDGTVGVCVIPGVFVIVLGGRDGLWLSPGGPPAET